MDNGQWTMDNGQLTMDNGPLGPKGRLRREAEQEWTIHNSQWTARPARRVARPVTTLRTARRIASLRSLLPPPRCDFSPTLALGPVLAPNFQLSIFNFQFPLTSKSLNHQTTKSLNHSSYLLPRTAYL